MEPRLESMSGLGVWPACFLLCGETAGVGVLSMPKALADTGVIGLLLIVVLGATAAYTGWLLSRCWLILQDRYPSEFTEHCRHPYPSIGERSLGQWGRMAISATINITMFGSGVVFFVLAAENLQTFIIGVAQRDLSLCWLLLVVFAVFVPVTWLGSPKDFWQLTLGAWLATVAVLAIISVDIVVDDRGGASRQEARPSLRGLFLAFGTLMFAYGIHPVVPSVQHDMKDARRFPRSLVAAMLIVVAMYIPMPLISFLFYGGAVDANILRTLPSGSLQYAALLIITAHLLLAANIIWTAVYQEAEHFCSIPNRFCWQRAALRTLIMAFGLFCALSLPHFGVLLDLVGGICFTSLCYIFPPLCYYFLCARPPAGFEPIAIPLWERTLMLELLVLGVFGAFASTYAGIEELLSTNTFVAPCYLDMNYYTSNHLG